MSERESSGHDSERAREQWVQALTEAWNAAVDSAIDTEKAEGPNAASEAFHETWMKKCRESGNPGIRLDWQQLGTLAVTLMPFDNRHYIFARVDKADLDSPLIKTAFEIATIRDKSKARVRQPAVVECARLRAAKGDINKLDASEFEKGEIS